MSGEGRDQTTECGKCFRVTEVAPCCQKHNIEVCRSCYVTNVSDLLDCDLFARPPSGTAAAPPSPSGGLS